MMKDLQIAKLIQTEKVRQKKFINLIASENFVSSDVLKALGSELTNKYSEGYPGKRYYGGNEIIDQVERLCQTRALKLFDLDEKKWGVNVQALSGSPANLAVYLALVPLGGKIMGMSLQSGGHLTHGQKVSASGKFWQSALFEVDPQTEVLDYEALKKQAIKEKPNLIVCGFTAYPRIVDFKKFRAIADACGAILHCDMSHFAGLVAGKEYPSPFQYCDTVVTTTHKTLRGPRGALIFARKDKFQKNKKGENISFAEKIDKAIFPGLQGGPHQNQIAAIAVALKEAAQPSFKKYARQVKKNASIFASTLKELGWKVISGGTDSHLLLLDVWQAGKGISGAVAEKNLEKAGIIVNKNTIPGETRSPMDPSGLRLGSAAETTRGMVEKDFIKLAKKIDQILRSK